MRVLLPVNLGGRLIEESLHHLIYLKRCDSWNFGHFGRNSVLYL